MSSRVHQGHFTPIETYKAGYPRFAALLSAHAPFLLCRRFNRLRARILLLKQDKLSILEERLDRIDHEERSVLFLGKCRLDKNVDRLSVLNEIETCLSDYDKFVKNSQHMLSIDPSEPRDIASLQNWLNGTGCIARDETTYLAHPRELASLAPAKDSALVRLEVWVEHALVRFYRGFRKDRDFNLSVDPNVYLYSGRLIKRAARVMLLFLITSLLLVPVVICNFTSTTSTRIVIIMISTIIYLSILSELTSSRTMELVLAGATYATVLIVFVSGTDEVRPLDGVQ